MRTHLNPIGLFRVFFIVKRLARDGKGQSFIPSWKYGNKLTPDRREYIRDTHRTFDIFFMLILYPRDAPVRRDGWSSDY